MSKNASVPILKLYIALCLLLASAGCIKAPTPIAGKVIDAKGAPIAGATVRLLTDDRNQAAETLTGVDGSFAFPRLAPGVYQLVVEMPGFHKATRSSVDTAIHTSRKLEVLLQPRQQPAPPPAEFNPGSRIEDYPQDYLPTALAAVAGARLPLQLRG
jgi:Carboxypeptidase regulatory-like domain